MPQLVMRMSRRKRRTMMRYRNIYETDPRFHRYVEACAKEDGVTVEEELAKKVNQNVGDYYAKTPMSETEKEATSKMSGGGC